MSGLLRDAGSCALGVVRGVGGQRSAGSDQRAALAFLRKYSNSLLAPQRWQREPYDRVLRTEERAQGVFAAMCEYVLMNPVRAELVEAWADYPYSGAVVAGYPDLHPRQPDYWERFWKVYARLSAGA